MNLKSLEQHVPRDYRFFFCDVNQKIDFIITNGHYLYVILFEVL